MKRFAIIDNDAVVNVAIAYDKLTENWIDLTDISPEPGVGWSYTNGQFIEPTPVIIPVAPVNLYISVGAFFDRFGDQKYPILSSTKAVVKALIQDSAVRKFIDLGNPMLPYGLQMLVDAGFTIDVSKIINDPIQESEKP